MQSEEVRTYSHVADATTARRMTFATLRLIVLDRKVLRVSLALMVPLLIILGVLDNAAKAIAMALGLLLWAVSMYTSVRQQCRAITAEGHRLETEFGPETLLMTLPAATVQVRWSQLKTIRVIGDVVAFTRQGVKGYTVLPNEVFPEAEVVRVRLLIDAREHARL